MNQTTYYKFAKLIIDFDSGPYTAGALAKKIADIFEADNPHFDRLKFYLSANVFHGSDGRLYRADPV